MRKPPIDFKDNSKNNNSEQYYDLYEDWQLIESSFVKQYGIRLRQSSEMPFDEFTTLLSGIMPDTPLGNIVTIRSERDPKVIKNFTSDQKRIYNEWKRKMANLKLNNVENYEEDMKKLALTLKTLFYKPNK